MPPKKKRRGPIKRRSVSVKVGLRCPRSYQRKYKVTNMCVTSRSGENVGKRRMGIRKRTPAERRKAARMRYREKRLAMGKTYKPRIGRRK